MKEQRIYAIYYLIVFAYGLFFLSRSYYPFIDVPSHLAEASIYKYYNDEYNDFDKYYVLNHEGYPNTFHLYIYALPFFKSVHQADRIIHFILIVSLPLIVLGVIISLKGNPLAAFLSLLFIYGYNITCGFTGNAIALHATLLVLWVYLSDLNLPALWKKVLITITLCAIFFMHAQIAVFAMLFLGCISLYRYYKRLGNLILCILYVIPVMALILNWILRKQIDSEAGDIDKTPVGEFLAEYYSQEFFITYLRRFKFLIADNLPLFEGKTGILIALLFFVLVIFFLIKGVLLQLKSSSGILQPIIADFRLQTILVFLATTLLCYFLLPERIPGQHPIYDRVTTLIPITLILIISRLPLQKRLYIPLVSMALILHFTLWSEYLIDFDQQASTGIEVIPENNGEILSSLIYEENFRGRPAFRHFQNYYISNSKGISTTRIIEFRFGMIRKNPENKLPEQLEKWGINELNVVLLDKIDLLLYKGNPELIDSDVSTRLENIKQSKDWYLYKVRKF
ncbi:MAG: hypothetical protein JJU28_11360 [Cyclobacteriaceae bacterium]|nr:hypothetical protein [Cyclobacteriaceae bacterium]